MTRSFTHLIAVAACLCALPLAAAAGGPHDGGMMDGLRRPPAFLNHLYRPEQVMKNQAAIGLTPEQRTAITQAIQDTQQRLLPLQWDLEAKSEEAAKFFSAPRLDPAAALAAAAPVMELEQRIKAEHLRLLVEIKNQLTPEQQDKLRELRPSECGRGRR